ncbi:MAG: glycosyltransferase family 9 protein [Betaproteobacteria bacterium]|nr:glycosyltransferase family 9 protein [Betaproteobacteria bacterium]
MRTRFPQAHIAALVNSYNAPVLEHNPDVDAVHAYTKAKHRGAGESLFAVYWRRWRLFSGLRKARFDYALIASAPPLDKALKLARWVRAQHIIGFARAGEAPRGVDIPIPYQTASARHQVEELAPLLQPFGIQGRMPAMRVAPDPIALEHARRRVDQTGWRGGGPRLLGIHISARKVPQRWPAERFIQLLHALHAQWRCRFLLFWSPGDENNPHHPGDDQKAAAILAACADLPVQAFPTETLQQLIAGLALTQRVVCSDGGAMHVAAALGKPIVCLFGNSDAEVWHPWGVEHELLQRPSRDVRDIPLAAVVAAYERLEGRLA